MTPLVLAPWLQAFAWALVHFLWEGALVGCAAFLALRFARRPETRYLVACMGLLAMVLAFIATLVLTPPEVTAIQAPEAFSGTITVLPPDLRERVHAQLPRILLAWSAGSAALALRLGAGLLWLYGPCLRGAEAAPEALEACLDRLRQAFAHHRPVRLLVSDLVDSPLVLGFWRSVILVPAAALLSLPEASLEAVLAHELAHVRRRDFLVNFLQNLAEVVFFFHPAVWWLSREIRAEREHCCDDAAAARCGGGLRFAQALADLEALRHRPPTQLAPSGHGGSLMHRIKRLLMPVLPAQTLTRPGLLALAAVTVLGGGVHWTPLEAAPPAPPAPPVEAAPESAPVSEVPAGTLAALHAAPSVDLPTPRADLEVPQQPAAPIPAAPAAASRVEVTSPAPHSPFRFKGVFIPAHAAMATIQGNASRNRAFSFEIPPHSRLGLDIKAAGDVPRSMYRLEVVRQNGPRGFNERAFNNGSDVPALVDLEVVPYHKANDGLGDSGPLEAGSFTLTVTRSWNPAAQDPRAKAAPFPPEALGTLPEVAFADLQVAYRPERPAYPVEALSAKAEAAVKLEVAVGRDGVPLFVKSEGGTPDFRAAAEAFAWRWVFFPPRVGQENRDVRVTFSINFKLN